MGDFGQPSKKCNCYVVSKINLNLKREFPVPYYDTGDPEQVPEGSFKHTKTVRCEKNGKAKQGLKNNGKPKISWSVDSEGMNNLDVEDEYWIKCYECREEWNKDAGGPNEPAKWVKRKCGDSKVLCEVETTMKELSVLLSDQGAPLGMEIVQNMKEIWNYALEDPPLLDNIWLNLGFIRGLIRHGIGSPKKYCGVSWGHYTPHPKMGADGAHPDECKTPLGNPGAGHGAFVEIFCNREKDFGE